MVLLNEQSSVTVSGGKGCFCITSGKEDGALDELHHAKVYFNGQIRADICANMSNTGKRAHICSLLRC